MTNNKNKNKLEIDKVITTRFLINTWTVGKHAKFTNKKLTKLLFCKRQSMEVFNLIEIKRLVLKLVPIMRTLFLTWRSNYARFGRNRIWYKTHKFPINIWFATITPVFGDIIEHAAKSCSMVFKRDRWLPGRLSGAIEATTKFKNLKSEPNTPLQLADMDFVSRYPATRFTNQYLSDRDIHYQTPDLLIIPDISNNLIIWQEAWQVTIPMISIINSDSLLRVDYPIPGNDSSIICVQIFCYLIASLIRNERAYFKHMQDSVSFDLFESAYTKRKKNDDKTK